MKAAAAVLLIVLSGCSTIDRHTPPPAGWPDLTIYEHRVDGAVMHARCKPYVGFLMMPLACAEINFAARRCDVWLTPDSSAFVREHELLHCAGYDHPGSTQLRDLWQLYSAGAVGTAAANLHKD